MSGRLFQNIVAQMSQITNKQIGVIDESGVIVACSDTQKCGKEALDVVEIFETIEHNYQVIKSGGFCYKVLGDKKMEHIVFIQGDDHLSQNYCSMLEISLSNVKLYYNEKFNKSNFIKNIILDNVLTSDISIKAKELHVSTDAHRVVILVRTTENNHLYVHDTIQSLFPARNKDFVIILDEHNTVLVKEVSEGTTSKDIEKIAHTIVDTLMTEVLIRATVGLGSVVNNIQDLATSFKEAQAALEVGKVFDTEKDIINYDSLGIARLIYHIPTTLCELFLNEVFKKESLDVLDNETIATIQKFFQNNLNVSEASRQLFVHRNTLVYRLDKVQKLTGLDLRIFDHAITFKVAMMVKKYLVSKPVKL